MTIRDFGNNKSDIFIIQPIDERSLSLVDKEFNELSKLSDVDINMKAVIVDNWFNDLSPWKNPPVYGDDAFGDGAMVTLDYILDRCIGKAGTYYIGGYSLAGLFALWSVCNTDVFSGVAAASPSVWFPGFTEYIVKNPAKCDKIYLSLGDREGKTKNPVMSTVDQCMAQARETFSESVKHCTFERNSGNHFTDVDKRCVRAFSWILEHDRDI